MRFYHEAQAFGEIVIKRRFSALSFPFSRIIRKQGFHKERFSAIFLSVSFLHILPLPLAYSEPISCSDPSQTIISNCHRTMASNSDDFSVGSKYKLGKEIVIEPREKHTATVIFMHGKWCLFSTSLTTHPLQQWLKCDCYLFPFSCTFCSGWDWRFLIRSWQGLGDTGMGWYDVAQMWSKTMPHVRFVLPTAYVPLMT